MSSRKAHTWHRADHFAQRGEFWCSLAGRTKCAPPLEVQLAHGRVAVTALPARLAAVPSADPAPQWSVVVNLLGGNLLGAWAGATCATKMRSAMLYKTLVMLLVLIAIALSVNHFG